KARIRPQRCGAHPLLRREVADFPRRQIDAIEVIVLVAVVVLAVQQDVTVLGPKEERNPAPLVGGEDPVGVLAEALTQNFTTFFLAGPIQASCLPSGESSGPNFSPCPKRTARGMSGGKSARAGVTRSPLSKAKATIAAKP